MSEQPQGPGWWQASDGKFYPPEALQQPSQPVTGAVPPTTQEPPARKALWKRWWFWLLVVLLLIVVVGVATGGGDPEETATPGPQPSATAAATEPGGEETQEPAPAETPEPAQNPYDELFGTFEPLSQQGTGPAVVELPEGATTGVVTANHQGSSNFAITALDAGNQSTGDLLVNTIGVYSGTTAYGLSSFGDAVRLQVEADGQWTISIVPVSAAPALTLPAQSAGDGVFLYDGAAATWTFSHDGESNFAVTQYDGTFPNLMVNEIGPYTGSVPALAGPSVITVNADGNWTIAQG